MTSFYFCTGGCRSGKSAYGQRLAESQGRRRVYVATAMAGDDPEMKDRIRRHREIRGDGWRHVEPEDILWADPAAFLRAKTEKDDVLLFDCLTLWISGCLMRDMPDETCLARLDGLLEELAGRKSGCVLVSNELGMGLVPESALGRRFRDLAGRANQLAARRAEGTILLVSGLPLALKGELPPV